MAFIVDIYLSLLKINYYKFNYLSSSYLSLYYSLLGLFEETILKLNQHMYLAAHIWKTTHTYINDKFIASYGIFFNLFLKVARHFCKVM